jgi:hypothetical protein
VINTPDSTEQNSSPLSTSATSPSNILQNDFGNIRVANEGNLEDRIQEKYEIVVYKLMVVELNVSDKQANAIVKRRKF